MFKCADENEESSLLQTIRIPKNLLFLPDKLPQPNYEKRQIKKNNNSFTDENKESLPEIKMSQKNLIRKRSDKKYDKDIRESDKKENSEERQNQNQERNSIGYIPTNNTQNGVSEDSNIRLNNDQVISIPKKKRRMDNDRSLDNIISHNIYSNALNGSGIGSGNVKVLKSENYEISNNNSILRDKSPYDDTPNLKKKSKDLMMLPNIRHQQNYDNK